MSGSDLDETAELAASLSALDAAEKLETQYKSSTSQLLIFFANLPSIIAQFENIEKMKETLDEKKDAKQKLDRMEKSEKQIDVKNSSFRYVIFNYLISCTIYHLFFAANSLYKFLSKMKQFLTV